jgi:magnesium-transporting ATPase (P-type)
MTLAFLTIAISQVFHSFNQRSDKYSIFSRKNEKNLLLPLLASAAIVITIGLAMISMYADGNNTTRVVNEVLGMNQLT